MKKFLNITSVLAVLILAYTPLFAEDLKHTIAYSSMAIIATIMLVSTERG